MSNLLLGPTMFAFLIYQAGRKQMKSRIQSLKLKKPHLIAALRDLNNLISKSIYKILVLNQSKFLRLMQELKVWKNYVKSKQRKWCLLTLRIRDSSMTSWNRCPLKQGLGNIMTQKPIFGTNAHIIFYMQNYDHFQTDQL